MGIEWRMIPLLMIMVWWLQRLFHLLENICLKVPIHDVCSMWRGVTIHKNLFCTKESHDWVKKISSWQWFIPDEIQAFTESLISFLFLYPTSSIIKVYKKFDSAEKSMDLTRQICMITFHFLLSAVKIRLAFKLKSWSLFQQDWLEIFNIPVPVWPYHEILSLRQQSN